MVIAGDFIQISFFEIYGAILLYGFPGVLFSLPVLWYALEDKKGWLAFSVVFWVFILPVILVLFTMIIAPDIHSRGHAYAAWQHAVYVWVPLLTFPSLIAGGIWYRRKKSGNKT